KRRPEYFALITSIITGIGIDTWLFLLNDLVLPTTLLSKFIFYGFGLFFTCLGTALYLQSSIAPNPLDGTMLVVSKLKGKDFMYSRALISIVLVTLAFFFTCLRSALYLQSSIAPNPLDGTMLVVSKLTGKDFMYSRALISIVLVTLAFFFDGAIGIGTLINALFSGLIISLFIPHVERFNQKIKYKIENI